MESQATSIEKTRTMSSEQQQLAADHVDVARRAARKYARNQDHYEFLLGHTYEALCLAAMDFDPGRCPSFRWWASLRCNTYARNNRSSNGTIFVPACILRNSQKGTRARRAADKLFNMKRNGWDGFDVVSDKPPDHVGLSDWVYGALSKLDEPSKQVILTWMNGFSYRESAEILGISFYTYEWMLRTAMNKLREILRPDL